jgi:hypothetical protein
LDLNRIVKDLEAERERIGRAISALVMQAGAAISAPRRGPKAKRRRGGLTAAGRRRLSLAMKRRWAERRAGKAKPKAAATRKRKGLTAAGRKKLSEAMKKRWAERRKAAAGK